MSEISIGTDLTKNGGCPVCGNSDATIPIHLLYADMLVGEKMPKGMQPGISRAKLMKQIFPPRIPKKNLAASLNPDFIIALGLIVIVYLVITQLSGLRNYLLPMGIGIIIFLGIYLFIRRWFIDRHDHAIKEREEKLSKVREKAEVWMELIYCPKDNLVFLPDHSLKLELDLLKVYLNADLKDQG